MRRIRELTATERREIRRLVRGCANYSSEHGCLPLDGECYMLSKWWTGSLCRYFERAAGESGVGEGAQRGAAEGDEAVCDLWEAVCGGGAQGLLF